PDVRPLALPDALPVSVFENTGSALYGGALLNIQQTQEYFPTAVGLATVEARHASWLNSLLGPSLVPQLAPRGMARFHRRAPDGRSEEHTSELQSPYEL